MTTLIRLENVNKHYGSFQALKNINLKIEEGEVVCVIGPSGSGKSTMIRCVNALEEHQDGRIVVDEHGQTSLAGVWAGGDASGGGLDLSVQAVEDGKRAAAAIDAALRGQGAEHG